MTTKRQEAVGLNHVSRIVQVSWSSGWQGIDPQNDDAVDGVVFFRQRDRDTGQIAFVQVKSGPSYYREWKTSPDVVGVQLGEDYINKHRPRWNSLPGPVVLVYVLEREKKKPLSWWADLRCEESYSLTNKQVVLLQRHNTFGPHSKGHIRRLAKAVTLDLPTIVARRRDINLSPLGHQFKSAIRQAYVDWGHAVNAERAHPTLGVVEVSRVGWRHITRLGRRPERIIHSLHLLGIARQMIVHGGSVSPIGRAKSQTRANGAHEVLDYLALRANVVFPHRGPAIVQVVLRRKRMIGKNGTTSQRLWFYSVYELGRSTHRSA